MTANAIYEFGDIRVDLGRMILLRGAEPVALEPKSFDVLRLLIENRDRLVTKEELLDTVWAGTFVTPNALTRAIAQLRKTLGDDAHEARYIETAARRGYRFIAPVTVVEGSAPTPLAAPRPTTPRGVARITLIAAAAALVIVLVAVLAMRRTRVPPAPKNAAIPPIERVTSRLGYNSLPSISPDGSLVAYVSDQTGGLEIYVTGLTAGARTLAITSDGGQNTEPAWSPDGAWIAFHSQKHHGIWVVPATGGAASQVTDFGSEPAWAPDSKTIVFTSDAGGMVHSQLWSASRDGSGLQQLTRMDEPKGGHHAAVWSHNGRWIVFMVFQTVRDQPLYAIDPRSHKVTRILAGASCTPAIAPHDDEIFFTQLQGSDAVPLVRMSVDPLTGSPVGAPAVVRDLPALPERIAISGNGILVAGLAESDTNLWAVDLDTATAREPVRLTQSAVRISRPAYSRDGRIAYMEVGGDNPSTWIMADDGSATQPALVDRPNGGPAWSPDGKRLLVRADLVNTKEPFWWVDLTTRKVTPAGVRGKGIVYGSISPRGDEIAYHVTGSDGTLNVWRQSIDGRTLRQVTFDREEAAFPSWSPDGKRFAIEVKRGDATNIGVVDSAGGPVRMLTSVRGQSWPNSWSPDGKWIAFAGEREGVWNIYAVSPDTREVRQFTRFTSVDGYVRYPVWSPDGRRIVFERSIPKASVWKLTP